MVSGSLSSKEGSGGGDSTAAPLKSYSEQFEELFPYYLAIGMTEEQYWDRDCGLVKAYRKAEEIRNQRKNQEMWMQGAYVYQAILRASPILHAFAKKGTKPSPYLEEPFALTTKQVEERKEEKAVKTYNKGKTMMRAFMESHNNKFEGK